MNRIKIIKRAGLQAPPEASETQTEDVNQALIKSQAGKVVENWVDEWRASQPKDSRRAFAALFGAAPSTAS